MDKRREIDKRRKLRELKAKALLESAPEEVRKEYESKIVGKDYSLTRLEHDITVAEGNIPKLKKIVLPEKLFRTSKEADKFFKRFRGRLLERAWVGEVDIFLYKERIKHCRRKHGD